LGVNGVKKFLLLFLFFVGVALGVSGHKLPMIPGQAPNVPLSSEIDSLLTIDVYYAPENKVITLDLEDYVKGVVACEMPASFHPESLRALAICARTYAVKKMRVFGGNSYSPDADVSSDHRTDQAWAPDEVLRERWGVLGTWVNMPKIEKAVNDTRGLILTYKGNPCELVYHSTCGGNTEAAKDVWGNNVPYLVSVPCSFCKESPYYNTQTVTLSRETVSLSLRNTGASVPVSSITNNDFVRVKEVSPTGRIKQVAVAGETMRGLEFRTALGLRSTMMSWDVQGDNVVFNVKGYGHGVGLCQYGADGMGKQGRTYLEILSYYYPGTQVNPLFLE
jgi:stage II sporulation protein D